ncbi:MAG: YceD family protein [Vampirovibrionales bacterium]
MLATSSPSGGASLPPNPDEELPLLNFWHSHDQKCHWEGRLLFEDPDDLMADVNLRLTVFKRSTGVEAVGRMEGSTRVACQQCTGEVWTPIEADVQERFVLSSLAGKSNKQEGQYELSDDDFYEVIDIRLPLDIRELARQLILLHAPSYAPCNVKPLKKCKNWQADNLPSADELAEELEATLHLMDDEDSPEDDASAEKSE